MWFLFCFVFIILGRCSNKYFCILVSVIYFLKNAKHNIFVNHTNLLYSVQIKMIFFCQKQYRFCFFLQETRSNYFGEQISYLDLKACFFSLIYQLISLPSWAMWPRIPLFNIKLDLYRVHLLCNFEASNIIKPE